MASNRAVSLRIPAAEQAEIARLFPGESSDFRVLVEGLALRCYLAGRIDELRVQRDELAGELDARQKVEDATNAYAEARLRKDQAERLEGSAEHDRSADGRSLTRG